jgi:hypothetical protein
VSAWRRIEAIPQGSELPWLYGVARNVVANQRRSFSRRLRLAVRVVSQPLDPAPETATDEWRRLVDGPWDPVTAVWTGTTIIVETDMGSDGTAPPSTTRRPTRGGFSKGWMIGAAGGHPRSGGAVATVAILPRDSGTPGALLDDLGNAIGEMAGRRSWPGDARRTLTKRYACSSRRARCRSAARCCTRMSEALGRSTWKRRLGEPETTSSTARLRRGDGG